MSKTENEKEKEKGNKKKKGSLLDKIDIGININILTLGSSTVGKTTFIWKYIQDSFLENTLTTTGIDIQTKYIKTEDGKKYRCNFFDTAGEEKYRSISVSHFKNADGVILMYDITNKKTYNDITQWIKDIREYKGEEFPMILIGNKCDLEDERAVTFEQGKELANNYGFEFMETSNKDGTNIEEAGISIINKVIKIKEIEEKEAALKKEKIENDKIKLQKENKKKKKKKCFFYI